MYMPHVISGQPVFLYAKSVNPCLVISKQCLSQKGCQADPFELHKALS